MAARLPKPVLDRVMALSIPEPNSGCRLWEGGFRNPTAQPNKRYGTIRLAGGLGERLAHRVVYEAAHGPLQPGKHVMHRCDMCSCVNIDHLYVGTNDENHADKAAKDRGKKRLTHEKAMDIHRMGEAGTMTHRAIAAHFGVGQSTVTRILNGTRRRHSLALYTRVGI